MSFDNSGTSMLMKEIPFLISNPPLPLASSSSGVVSSSSSSSNDDRGGGVGGRHHEQHQNRRSMAVAVADVAVADVAENRNDNNGTVAKKMIGLQLIETTNTAGCNNNVDDGSLASRGMTSTFYSKVDGRTIITNGIAGKSSVIQLSIIGDKFKEKISAGGKEEGAVAVCHSLEIDLSSLLDSTSSHGGGNGGGSGSSSMTMFDRVMGTSVYVTHPTTPPSTTQRRGGEGGSSDDGWEPWEGNDTPPTSSTTNTPLLHLRMIDIYGTIVSLTFTYPDMKPHDSSSFLLPLSAPSSGLCRPHPGSIIETPNQTCFPTVTTVVFALNPHLYCVDFGNSSIVGGIPKTRVWTNIHVLTSDPITDDDYYYNEQQQVVAPTSTTRRATRSTTISTPSTNTTTATKRPKRESSSISGILATATKRLMGIPDMDPDAKFEYHDDDDDDTQLNMVGGGSGSIPPIAALADLSLSTKINNNDDDYCDDNNNVARVATLHSDGSIRVWTAELSSSNKGDNIQKLLRIPSVQRIAIDSSSAAAAVGRGRGRTNTTTTTTSRYINPPLPDTTVWDPRFDALTLRGRSWYNENSGTFEYEIAVYIHCYTTNNTLSKKISGDGGSLVYIFQGDIVNNVPVEALMLPSGDTAMMQMLNLPNDTASVVDISWVKGRDLIVLLRQSTNGGSSNDDVSQVYYYTIGGNEMVENERVILAVYPLVEVPSKGFLSPTRGSSLNVLSYMTEPSLPSNITLPYLEFNHFGCTNYLSVEEELDRYICHSEATNSIIESTEMKTTDTVTKAQAQIDRAGLLAILQPFGRIRASALAIHRAMSSLNLLDVGVGPDEVRPTVIVSAMRKWTEKSAFQSSSTDLIPTVSADDTESHDGTTPTKSLSVYHAFTSATKKKPAPGRNVRMYEEMDMDGESEASALEVNDVDTARLSHRLKWIRLLAEIRRQEVQLNEVLCLTMFADSSILFRGDMVTTITMDSESAATTKEPALAELSNQERNVMTGLDELAVDLFTCISKDPKLRQLLSKVESSLYNGSSKASSFIHDWIEMGLSNIELLSQLEVLGRSAMVQLPIVDAHIQLLNELSQFDSKEIEAWLIPNTSASAIVCTRLAILDASSNSSVSFGHLTESNAPYHTAATLISARIESIRILSLSRLILVFGSPQVHPVPIQHGALRSTLYCTALIWSVHQQSSVDKQLTVLEEDLSKKIRTGAIHSGVHEIADSFVSIAFSSMIGGSLLFGKTEPHVALRLVAPLVEFRSQLITPEAEQKMREVVAHCLLFEAAALLKHAERSSESDVSPMSLWRLASKSLLHKSATSIERCKVISNLMNRVGTLERHLNSVQGCKITLPLCCEVTLEAIQDAISAISSLSTPEMWKRELQLEIPTLWDSALHVSMRGSLWDDAFQACINNPIAARRRANFKVLILGMIDAGGLGKLIDMSLSVVELDFSMAMQMDSQDGLDNQATDERVDLFDLAAEIIEEAAVEQGTSRTGTSYFSCLYALHASRGHWRQAAYAMDFFGMATSESVLSYKSKSQEAKALSKAASKKVMDDACLAAQACFHAISLVDKPSDRYLLTGNPDNSMLLTEEDLEHRAVRAMALRTFYMDENSPDAVGNILEMSSRDTIDTLARFAYYEQAISIALSVSSKRKGLLPGGVDLCNDALQHILCVYLVPTAITKSTAMKNDGSGLHNLQSRSKLAQIRASSSSCALGSAESVVTAKTNSCVSIGQSENMLQSVMAMNLLQQYTTMYSKRCHGLGLCVAKFILGKDSELPMWLKELCIFGYPTDERSNDGLFAQSSKGSCGNFDPAGLMRLYIEYHQYGEACNVVTLLLSKQRTTLAASCRLPEKGSIDYVPYDLIDMLWDIIESIITSNSCTPSDGVYAQVQLLIKKRECMEQALENHFESLKISEYGLSSARVISMHK